MPNASNIKSHDMTSAGMTVEEYAATGYETAAVPEQGEPEIVSVTLAPWLEDYYVAKLQQAEDTAREVLETAQFFTDEQLRNAVMMVDPNDPEVADVARFFLQILAERDRSKALEVFREWKNSGTGAA